jgi:tRNA-2-methylthio-N6-dimethylallyladenosine synthase
LLEVDKLYEKGLSRTRFTSAHPQDFTDDVIEALANMKTRCPYIHLPVQHGSNQTLRAMNRNYTIEKYNDIIAKIRKAMPDTTLATDIIVGFPGETEAQFQELCDFADTLKLDFSYTAIFSPRRHTPAARMEKDFIEMDEKKSRFHRFDEVVKKHAFARRAVFVGKEAEVLVEKSEPAGNGLYRNAGRTREFFEVWFLAGRSLIGKEVKVT